jgi:hypothetical protein
MSAIWNMHGNEIIFTISTIIGLIIHYAKKRLKNETETSLKEWFTTSNPAGSIASIGSSIVVIVTALANGVINETMTFWSVVYIGLVTGLAVDSATNKDQIEVGRSNFIAAKKLKAKTDTIENEKTSDTSE